jgi:hypothetical protein
MMENRRSKPKIKLFFTDFWPVFDPEDNYFIDLLSPEFDIELDEENPDFLIYSVFGTRFHRYDCVRIFYTGENIRPDMNQCDYAFCYDYSDNPRIFRMPLYPFFNDPQKLLRRPPVEEIMKQKTEFCNFIYSNSGPTERVRFFKKLSKYKKVISAGRYMNNTGVPLRNKVEFVRKFKFSIAFENESYPGYTTEKVFEPMLVDSLPIYWGNPLIGRDFNSRSFLNYHDFESEDDLIDRIIEIDSNDELWAEYISQPYYENNQLSEYVDPVSLRAKFRRIIDSDIKPIARSLPQNSPNAVVRAASRATSDLKFELNKYSRKVQNFSLTRAKIKLMKRLGR